MKRRLSALPPALIALLAFALAGIVMLGVAFAAAQVIERRSGKVISAVLTEAGATWATVTTDGLQVHLTGTAPTEAARLRVLNLAGGVVDGSRVIDGLDVAPASALTAPRFSVEMLRNDEGIQLIGLMPETPGDGGLSTDTLGQAAARLATGATFANMLETAAYPAPGSFDAALRFGLQALELLPRSKISVGEAAVKVTAIADSEAEKRRFESELAAAKPANVGLTLDISAPRPVLTPFTLRFLKDAQGTRFDACSADTERARQTILAAAIAAGMEGTALCTVGMGTPSPRWAEAAAVAIKAVAEMGAGSVTFSDADVTLAAGEGVTQAVFDRVVGDLRAVLPDAFSLQSVAPVIAEANKGPEEFTASLSPEGRVELRGRLVDEAQQAAVEAFARAAFGADRVYAATRLDPDLPDGWPVRVLAGLDSLDRLTEGTLLVRADLVEVKGVTGSQATRAAITQLLSDRLGQGETFRVDVRYDEDLDPTAALPTPQECAAEVAGVLAQGKITFTPGSAEIAGAAAPVIAGLADVLADCPGIQLEIAGYTDSQGSTTGNQALSQARAEAVLIALQGRRVDVSGMTAVGYGEAFPIADNSTEGGREANRRIEFVLKQAAVAVEAPADGSGPDFSADTSPSVAPTEKTRRPRPRPDGIASAPAGAPAIETDANAP